MWCHPLLIYINTLVALTILLLYRNLVPSCMQACNISHYIKATKHGNSTCNCKMYVLCMVYIIIVLHAMIQHSND